MQPHQIQTPEELIEYLQTSNQPIAHVPRRLLIQVLGDAAQPLLPALPDYIAVNVEQALMIYEAKKKV